MKPYLLILAIVFAPVFLNPLLLIADDAVPDSIAVQHVKPVDSLTQYIQYGVTFKELAKSIRNSGQYMDPFIVPWWFSNTDTTDTGGTGLPIVFFTVDTVMKEAQFLRLLDKKGFRPLRFEEIAQLDWSPDPETIPLKFRNVNIVAFGSGRPCALIGGRWIPYLKRIDNNKASIDLRWFGKIRPDGWWYAATPKKNVVGNISDDAVTSTSE